MGKNADAEGRRGEKIVLQQENLSTESRVGGTAIGPPRDPSHRAYLDDANLQRAVFRELGEVLLEEIAGHVRLREGEGAVGGRGRRGAGQR